MTRIVVSFVILSAGPLIVSGGWCQVFVTWVSVTVSLVPSVERTHYLIGFIQRISISY